MPRSRSFITAVIFTVLSTSAGCASMPFLAFDKIAFWQREVVPDDILARHGPTTAKRLDEIDDVGRRAAKASPDQQQAIAMRLAETIKQEEDAVVRQHLIRAISQCRTAASVAILHAGLADEDLDVQLAACEELGRWESPETTSLLGQIVSNDEKPIDLRLAAIETLGKFKDGRTATVIAPALESNADPALQYRAVKSLAKLTGLDYGNDLVAWRNHFGKPSADNRTEQIAVPNFSPSTGMPGQQVGFQQ